MDAYFGEIRAFAFGFVPQGWLACNGQEVSIRSYQPLYAIIGTLYGTSRDPSTLFVLPNLNGKAVIGAGQGPGLTNRQVGRPYGSETVSLSSTQIPVHNHGMVMEVIPPSAGTQHTTPSPVANNSWLTHPWQIVTATTATVIPNMALSPAAPDTTLHASTVGVSGAGQAHDNRQPYLPLLYCICCDGVFPVNPQ